MIAFVLNQTSIDIAGLLRQAHIMVWTSMNDVPLHTRNDLSFNALERVDAIVLELTHIVPEVHFILAQAIILRRPTLCLYTKGNEPQHILQHLAKHRTPNAISIRPYTRTNLDLVLHKFLKSINQSANVIEVPKIKFTLRLTAGLEHYLDWLSEHKAINKADYIRQLIRDDAERQEEYKA